MKILTQSDQNDNSDETNESSISDETSNDTLTDFNLEGFMSEEEAPSTPKAPVSLPDHNNEDALRFTQELLRNTDYTNEENNPNEYEMIVLSAKRAKTLYSGTRATIKHKHWEKMSNVALIEVSNNRISLSNIKEEMLQAPSESSEEIDSDSFNFFENTDSESDVTSTDIGNLSALLSNE